MIGKVTVTEIKRDFWKSELRETPRPLTAWGKRHRRMLKAYLAKRGRFSVFWATENQQRAWAMDNLVDSGDIIVTQKGYPWYDVAVMPDAGGES